MDAPETPAPKGTRRGIDVVFETGWGGENHGMRCAIKQGLEHNVEYLNIHGHPRTSGCPYHQFGGPMALCSQAPTGT